MSNSPKPQCLSPTFPCAVIIPIVTRTPNSNYESPNPNSLISPIQQFAIGASNNDDFNCNFYNQDSSCPPTPNREGFTLHQPSSYTNAHPFLRQSPTFLFQQNNLDKTPNSGMIIARDHLQGKPKYGALSFSPVLQTRQGKPLIPFSEQGGVERKHHYKEIRFGPVLSQNEDFEDDFEEEEEEEEKEEVPVKVKKTRSKKNGSKGLKTLSNAVYKISKNFQRLTYKEIATLVIAKFIEQGKIKENDNEKEIQNAKRRVYDALNVLVAAQVLERAGKYVKPAAPKPKSILLTTKQEKLQNLKKIVEQKKNKLFSLKKKIVQNKEKFTSVLRLQTRNRENKGTPIAKNQKIRFPFFMITLKKGVEMDMRKEEGRLRIEPQESFGLTGDVMTLCNLDLPYPDIVLPGVKKETWRLIGKVEEEVKRFEKWEEEKKEKKMKEEEGEGRSKEEILREL